VAALAGETKTGAVRQALRERRERLLLARGGGDRADRVAAFLARRIPHGVPGGAPSKEEERILGYGPEGV